MTVDILLATYNGEQFLKEQLESIFNQTNNNFKLIIRDDGSTDGTGRILKEYKSKYPDKINLIIDSEATGSAKMNFSKLMEASSAEYIFFCDHDDIWLPNKIQIMLTEIQKIETSIPYNLKKKPFLKLKICENVQNTIFRRY